MDLFAPPDKAVEQCDATFKAANDLRSQVNAVVAGSVIKNARAIAHGIQVVEGLSEGQLGPANEFVVYRPSQGTGRQEGGHMTVLWMR
jgi:hypothetical protein